MPSARKLELDRRLKAYSATVRSSSRTAVKHAAENWQVYAAVTGSALAMATNASAQIIYSGPHQNVKAGPLAASSYVIGRPVTNENNLLAIQNIGLKTAGGNPLGVSFRIGAEQFPTDFWVGFAGLTGGGRVGFLTHSTQHNSYTYNHVRKLHFGASISKAGPFNRTSGNLATQRFFLTGRSNAGHTTLFADRTLYGKGGWPAGKIGFAGFSFSTTPGGVTDYGWIRLQYCLGPNGAANEIEAIDWAYGANGTPITVGEVSAPTPEPATGALALLAAGAAGVAALRRRRRTAV